MPQGSTREPRPISSPYPPAPCSSQAHGLGIFRLRLALRQKGHMDQTRGLNCPGIWREPASAGLFAGFEFHARRHARVAFENLLDRPRPDIPKARLKVVTTRGQQAPIRGRVCPQFPGASAFGGAFRHRSPPKRPMLAQRPTDRRAGCGKTARPVRREGQGTTPCSYPYRPSANASRMRLIEKALAAGGRI